MGEWFSVRCRNARNENFRSSKICKKTIIICGTKYNNVPLGCKNCADAEWRVLTRKKFKKLNIL